ncbi:MAG: NnrS family protein [Gammaproteobacteria bacterium]
MSHPSASPSLFALGFRPFFLLAALGATALMAVWLGGYLAGWPLPSYYGPIAWHGHEMLFGYTAAVVAGFLLTAVRNWTGQDTPSGLALAALAALWLAGRILPWVPMAPDWLTAATDLAFLPALGVVFAPLLWRSGQRHNLVFLVLLALLTAANLLVHLERLNVIQGPFDSLTSLGLGVDLVIVLISVVGGRVIPFFIERGTNVRLNPRPGLERLAVASVALWFAAAVFAHGTVVQEALAWLAALINGLRLVTWHHRRLWSVPLLWVLYLGYGWLVAGLVLNGAALAGWIAPSLAVHAFTAGAIGVMTLGMMARVALGHTGRPMQAARTTTASFVLINFAALARVAMPAAAPTLYLDGIFIAGVLWIAAFILFLLIYTPYLIRPRADGRPG